MKVARVYLRVSTDAQDLKRQEEIITTAKEAGYYVAGVYREKASGARADRPELLRMIADLQPGCQHQSTFDPLLGLSNNLELTQLDVLTW